MLYLTGAVGRLQSDAAHHYMMDVMEDRAAEWRLKKRSLLEEIETIYFAVYTNSMSPPLFLRGSLLYLTQHFELAFL